MEGDGLKIKAIEEDQSGKPAVEDSIEGGFVVHLVVGGLAYLLQVGADEKLF